MKVTGSGCEEGLGLCFQDDGVRLACPFLPQPFRKELIPMYREVGGGDRPRAGLARAAPAGPGQSDEETMATATHQREKRPVPTSVALAPGKVQHGWGEWPGQV